MINYFRREFVKLSLWFIIMICIYNSVNLTFFNEKSVTKIFKMNDNILNLNKDVFATLSGEGLQSKLFFILIIYKLT